MYKVACVFWIGALIAVIAWRPALRVENTVTDYLAFDPRLDPKLGELVPLKDNVSESALHEGPILLIAVGSCDTFSVSGFRYEDLDRKAFVRTVVLVEVPLGQTRPIIGGLPPGFEVVLDRGGKLTKKLNSVYPPRLYILDKTFRIAAIQSPAESPYSFCTRGWPRRKG